MTEPMEAVNGHHGGGHPGGQRGGQHGGQHGRRRDERGGGRHGDWHRDPGRKAPVPGTGDDPADDPPSPGTGPDRVAVLLRKLRDAAAAHDRDLAAAHCTAPLANWRLSTR